MDRGAGIIEVQKTFKKIFNFGEGFSADGNQFDLLISDGQKIKAGSIEITGISTPGHTPACMTYLIEDCLFTGDTIFMPDNGTGRCDFPAGSATQLYRSIKEKIYSFPDNYKIFVGHDYMPNGRDLKFESSVGEEKQNNIHLKGNSEEQEFVSFRQSRDKTLNAPRLLLPSIQININGGHLPDKEANGMSYIKLPILT